MLLSEVTVCLGEDRKNTVQGNWRHCSRYNNHVYAVCQCQYESPHTVRGRAERFASSAILWSSNRLLWNEGGVGVYMAWRRVERNLNIFRGGVCRSEHILKYRWGLKCNIKMGIKKMGKFGKSLGFLCRTGTIGRLLSILQLILWSRKIRPIASAVENRNVSQNGLCCVGLGVWSAILSVFRPIV